jgi:RNA polymerase sigma-70 factor (ECF subfamily)
VDHPEEQLWLRQAQAGDRQAFAALVRCYWGRIHRWLHGLTRSSHLAEDLTQDTFLRAWTSLHTLREGARFRPWLFRIARNRFLDNHKARGPVVVQALPDRVPAGEPGPLAAVLAQECQTLLHDACERLPVHLRAPLLLWTHEELSYAEIAEVLGVTEETARWRVCKARKQLLKLVGAYLDKLPS